MPPKKKKIIIEEAEEEESPQESPVIKTKTKKVPSVDPGMVPQETITKIIDKLPLVQPYALSEEEILPSNEEFLKTVPGDIVLSESGKLLKRYLTLEGFGKCYVDIYNNWINVILPRTISSMKLT